MAKTVRSRKQKGMRAQKDVVNRLMQRFPLSENEIKSIPSGVPGADLWLSERAREFFDFAVEVKNTEKLNIWEALKQTESIERNGTPLLIFKRNHSKMYCAMDFDDFLDLIEELIKFRIGEDFNE